MPPKPGSATITCPACSNEFEPTAAMEQSIREQMETEFNKRKTEYNQKVQEQRQQQEAEFRRRETELQLQNAKLEQARAAQELEVRRKVDEACEQAKKDIKKEIEAATAQSFEARLKHSEEQHQRSQEELRNARQKELDFLRKEEAFQQREAQLELDKQKAIAAERTRIQEELRQTEAERFKIREEEHSMRMREYEKQLDDQKKLIEEMKRKAEQGSMQLQGEVQELALEELLRSAFPYDTVAEVGKGMRGADCILTVRNAFGQDCGCIIFESKRTKEFGGDWIDKLKTDMLSCSAELAVIVTQAFPKDMDRFGERQGVYVCNFGEVKSLVTVLRNAVLKLYEARISQENKGDKMVALYDYLTGSEFMGQWNTMRENFSSFRMQLQKERDDFEKNWKKKEKMLDLIIKNSLQISGSIEGISGIDSMNWSASALEDSDSKLISIND
jgi:hypothetical protein